MEMSDYDDFVEELWINDPDDRIQLARCGLGLAGESGEVAELLKKHMRGDGLLDQRLVASELGDVLFYVTITAHLMGFGLEDIAELNRDKLDSRRKRGKIRGNGSER